MKNLWTYSEIHFNRFLHKSVESTKRSILEIRNSNFESKLFRARTRISSTGWISFKTVSFSASDIFSRFIRENWIVMNLRMSTFLSLFWKWNYFVATVCLRWKSRNLDRVTQPRTFGTLVLVFTGKEMT